MPRRRCRAASVEDLELSDTQLGAVKILEHVLERVRAGDVTGVMVVAERPSGAFTMHMSSTANVAERIGRLVLLQDAVLERAEEDRTDE